MINSWTDDDWVNMDPHYHQYPQQFKRVVPYLLASICYHWDWIVATFPENHFIFNIRFVASDKMATLKPLVHAGIILNKNTGMMATGVPFHVSLKHQQSLMQNKLDGLQQLVTDNNELVRSYVSEEIEKNNDVIVNKILQRVDVHGAVAVTQQDLVTSLSEFQQQLIGNLERFQQQVRQDFLNRAQHVHDDIVLDEDNNVVDAVDNENNIWWTHYNYGGNAFNPIPENYELQAGCNTVTWFYLWFFGNKHQMIRPFYMIEGKQFPRKEDRSKFSKGKMVMEYLCNTILNVFELHINGPLDHVTAEVIRICGIINDSILTQTVQAVQMKMRLVLRPSEVATLFHALFIDLVLRIPKIKYDDAITTVSKKMNIMMLQQFGPRRKKRRQMDDDDNDGDNNDNDIDDDSDGIYLHTNTYSNHTNTYSNHTNTYTNHINTYSNHVYNRC